MATYKCKMCGGDLHIEKTDKVVECEYCGTTQTVPSADSEKKMTLFNRANRLRLANEFDKAAGIYENIIAEFPEEAEAYWGAVLCKYGIEYVDDPATGKKIPTCHRSSFDSVMEDENFEQACENADVTARRVYREEAKRLEEIRKGIIEVSAEEAPYDIFICYKETDENGDRTVDSAIAQDVYTALTEKGYRVFFSRISLEDKLGQEYEPYIFAALNSAKVMLVFGTDYEYFNAVWVKNEWSRFLKLIAAGQKKTLIPCYKDIDVYDMPKEFAKLQSQDMGKVGAMQDLVRGIEKILGKQNANQTERIQNASTVTTSSLQKRASLFLQDSNWSKATEYYNRILDIDPENADAYLGLLLAKFQVKKPKELSRLSTPFDQDELYKKVLLFAPDQMKEELENYNKIIRDRNYENRCSAIYTDVKRKIPYIKTEEEYTEVVKKLNSIQGYKDSNVLYELAKRAYNEAIYNEAVRLSNGKSIQDLVASIKKFKTIRNYRDSIEQQEKVYLKAKALQKTLICDLDQSIEEKGQELQNLKHQEEALVSQLDTNTTAVSEKRKVFNKYSNGSPLSILILFGVPALVLIIPIVKKVLDKDNLLEIVFTGIGAFVGAFILWYLLTAILSSIHRGRVNHAEKKYKKAKVEQGEIEGKVSAVHNEIERDQKELSDLKRKREYINGLLS